MAKDIRIDKLYPALDAQERAILVLQAVKAKREEDPKVYGTTPSTQVRQFNRYIALMNAVGDIMASYITVLELLVDQLEVRFGWLMTFRLWAWSANHIGRYIVFGTKEPITESEYQLKLKEARQGTLALSEAAEILTDREEGSQASKAAWNRIFRAKREELVRLLKSGVLVGKGGGKAAHVQAGSFYDWLGEPVPLLLDWASDCEVYPDEQAEDVLVLRKRREEVRELFRRMPSEAGFDPSRDVAEQTNEEECPCDPVVRHMMESLPAGLQLRWQELRAAEMILETTAEQFNGEDPLMPSARQAIDDSKAKVRQLAEDFATLGVTVELSEPDEGEVAAARALLDKAVETHREWLRCQ